MARTLKFIDNEHKLLYDGFIMYLSTRIPSYRLPAKEFYKKINNSLKNYLNKKNERITHIIEISDIAKLEGILYSIQSSYVYINEDDLKTQGLKYYIDFLKEREKNIESKTCTISVEQDLSEEYKEGGVLDCHGDKYERNHKAREECLKYYGYNCRVCGFNFEERYGKRGRNFIEVHHRVPLSERKEEYNVDPIRDLIPVCPNCHAMLHRTKPAITVEELISLINKDNISK